MFEGQNKRLVRGIVAGIISAIVCGVIYGFVMRVLPIEFEVLVVAVGYGVGNSIKKYGRGVKPIFSTIGAICAIFAFFVSYVTYYSIGGIPIFSPLMINYVISSVLSLFDFPWGIISLMFRVLAVIVAYRESRIV